MRSALVGLESQWEMLEQLLEKHKETAAANTDDSSQSVQKGGNNQIVNKRPTQCTSTIDWDGDSDAEDEVEKKQINNVGGPNKNTLFTTKKKVTIRSKEPEQVASQLAKSNFDWGGDDDVQKAARRASLFSSCSGETVTKIINGTQIIEEEEEKQKEKQPHNDVPILLRIFQPRNNKKPKEINGGRDSDVGATTASVNSKNSQEKGWWGRKRGVRNDDDSIATAASSIKTNNEKNGWALIRASVSTPEGSVNDKPPPLFQLFGGRSKRQLVLNETQNNTSNDEGSVNNAPISVGGRKGKEDHTNNTNDDKTVETHSPSYCSDTSSSHQVATKNNSKKASTDSKDEKIISSLQVKLRGCDSAASTLQQLLSYQTRHLFNLQYERNSLQSSSQFESSHSKQELEKLRNQLHFAKVERRRKSRFLEDAHKKKKRTQDQEELLKGELESIRTELFMLNNIQQMAERGGGGGGGGNTNDDGGDFLGDNNHGMDGSSSHDRVVIVGGNSSQTTTEWR